MINTTLHPLASFFMNLLLLRLLCVGVYNESISDSSKNAIFVNADELELMHMLNGVLMTKAVFFAEV